MSTLTKNKILAILASVFRITATISATGTLMQTFLSVLEFDADLIYIHSCFVQASNVCTILLCSRFGDRGNVIRRVAIVQIPIGILFLGYLPLCVLKSAETEAFILLLAVSILQSVLMALSTVCDYKLPYFIYRADDYGMVAAVGGILCAIFSFGIGAVMSVLSVHFPYTYLMFGAFLISGAMYVASGICLWFLKPLIDMEAIQERKGDKQERIPLMTIFKEPVFCRLVMPNLLRGFANGMTLVLAVVASEDLGYSEQVTTVMVSVSAVAGFVANGIFGWVSQHISPRYAVFAGSLTFICLPLLLIPGQPILFLVLIFIIMFGRSLIDNGVPAVLIYVVPAKIAGPYHAYRMMMHTGGALLATAIATVLPSSVLLPAAMIFQLISGAYYTFWKKLEAASPSPKSGKR